MPDCIRTKYLSAPCLDCSRRTNEVGAGEAHVQEPDVDGPIKVRCGECCACVKNVSKSK
jgi:hypothetical protein